jgi:hypoxanthine phosphoribosyltransferase
MEQAKECAVEREYLAWQDVDALIDHLIPQFKRGYDALLMITRGGIIPGGLIAEALSLQVVLTAAVDFLPSSEQKLAWPTFWQFPADSQLRHKTILVVDDIWDSGRTIMTVKGRTEAVGGVVETAVLHYKPGQSFFAREGPNYYAAITHKWIVYPWEIDRGRDLMMRPLVPVLS